MRVRSVTMIVMTSEILGREEEIGFLNAFLDGTDRGVQGPGAGGRGGSREIDALDGRTCGRRAAGVSGALVTAGGGGAWTTARRARRPPGGRRRGGAAERSQLLGDARSKARCSWIGRPSTSSTRVLSRSRFGRASRCSPRSDRSSSRSTTPSGSTRRLQVRWHSRSDVCAPSAYCCCSRGVSTSRGEGPALEEALDADAVERLRVGPLSIGAIHTLLQRRLGRPFARPTLRRLHEISGGNPFYALELARGLGLGRRDRRFVGAVPGSGDVGAAGGRPPRRARRSYARGVAPHCRARKALACSPRPPPGSVRTRSSRRSQRKWSSARPTRSDSAIRCSRRSSTRRRRTKSGEELMDASPRSWTIRSSAPGTSRLPPRGLTKRLPRSWRRPQSCRRSRGASVAAAELAEQALRLTPLDASRGSGSPHDRSGPRPLRGG